MATQLNEDVLNKIKKLIYAFCTDSSYGFEHNFISNFESKWKNYLSNNILPDGESHQLDWKEKFNLNEFLDSLKANQEIEQLKAEIRRLETWNDYKQFEKNSEQVSIAVDQAENDLRIEMDQGIQRELKLKQQLHSAEQRIKELEKELSKIKSPIT